MLHEILAQPPGTADEEKGDGYNVKDRRQGSEDSGYFSRRGSKATSAGDSKRDSVLTEAMEGIAEDYEGAEEADDEGADLEDDDDGDGNLTGKMHTFQPSPLLTQASNQPDYQNRSLIHPQQTRIHIGSRFISPAPRKPASPHLSAEEAVTSKVRDRKGASI